MSESLNHPGQDPSLVAGNATETKRAIFMNIDAHEWHNRVDELMAEGTRIITFRGAGTVNGIEPIAVINATEEITKFIAEVTEAGTTVVIMFDGDEDNRERPDVGAVFGRVADAFKDNSNVVPIAVQTKSWYFPKSDGAVLESTMGTTYETYIFPDDMPGRHDALTQSEALAQYSDYEQIFVGPAGPIAFTQLQDLNVKATGRADEVGRMRVTVIVTPINHELDQVFQDYLEVAGDDGVRAMINAKIDQRATKPYGVLFTPQGELAIESNQYPNLDIHVHKVVTRLDR